MFHRNTRKLAGIVTGVAAALLAGTAGASAVSSSFDQPPSITVHYQDLDLTTTDGRSTLYWRMSRAAQLVCPDADAADLSALRITQACRSAAIQRAVRSIGGPTMAKLAVEHGVTLS
jgi:UrcA family protein